MPIKDYTLKNKKNIVFTEDQNEIVEFLIKRQWAFNLAQTGFGKTLTTIAAYVHKFAESKEKMHCIVIIPVSAVKPFTDTFDNILGVPYNLFTSDKKRPREGALFTIFTYSMLSNNLFSKSKSRKIVNEALSYIFDLKNSYDKLWMIADEAHALQSKSTAQYKTVDMIKRLVDGGWFLTATPILNSLQGLYNMVDIVIPGYFGTLEDFFKKYEVVKTEQRWLRDRFGKPVKRTLYETVGYKNLEDLKARFDKIGIVKAKKYDVTFNFRSVKLSEGMLKYYRWAADGIFSGTYIEDKNSKQKELKELQDSAGARLHDLQRVVSNSHPRFKAIKSPDMITDKEMLLINTIREVISKNEATLIFFSYLDTLERVKYILSKVRDSLDISKILEVSGSVEQSKRKLVENSIEPRSVILITSAGTESMNLQKANNIIFYETPFALRQFIQAVGRITRMDSKFEKFNAYILEAEGTIDTYKKLRLIANAEPIKAIIGGGNSLPAEMLMVSILDKQDMKNEFLWKS